MMLGLTELSIIILPILGYFLFHAWRVNQFFVERKIHHLKPNLIFGNILDVMMQKKHIIETTKELYATLPEGSKYCGLYNFMKPITLITDLDLIKTIFVKDFQHFTDHIQITDENVDPLVGHSLFFLKGEKWREMRSTLSPAFTSSKMRGMFPFIEECSNIFVQHIKDQMENQTPMSYVEINAKDFSSRYSNDVIASCAFGINVDSINDKSNQFFTLCKDLTTIGLFSTFKLFLYFLSPKIIKLLKLELSDKSTSNYFRRVVIENMSSRKERKFVRNDMIQLLIQAMDGTLQDENSNADDTNVGNKGVSNNKSNKTDWTEDELVAQALIFIFAGFDTVSTALSFLIYELATNKDVQAKLQKEIDDTFENNKIDFNTIPKMKYLDMVISESLRLWPPAIILDRKCVKTYVLPEQKNSPSHRVNPGEGLWVSVYDIHRDPNIYVNPETFDPERFSDENKSTLHPCAYMPFGSGPRVCIGNRFALMEMKLFIVNILLNFDIIKTEKTPKEIKLKPNFFDLIPENGIWVGFKERQK